MVQSEGGRDVLREVTLYYLDAIIAVGYRVNSYQATQFRIWATNTLREFMIKGFVLDDERLKQGNAVFGKDYFDDLLERIREIRASERRFYQKVADIYALAADCDPRASLIREIFATVKNKLHCPGRSAPPVTAALEHQREVVSAAFSSDGTRIDTASWDNTARVWDVRPDMGTLADWAAVAERSPFVVDDRGVLVRRVPARGVPTPAP